MFEILININFELDLAVWQRKTYTERFLSNKWYNGNSKYLTEIWCVDIAKKKITSYILQIEFYKYTRTKSMSVYLTTDALVTFSDTKLC